jgi:hypothetical protein
MDDECWRFQKSAREDNEGISESGSRQEISDLRGGTADWAGPQDPPPARRNGSGRDLEGERYKEDIE